MQRASRPRTATKAFMFSECEKLGTRKTKPSVHAIILWGGHQENSKMDSCAADQWHKAPVLRSVGGLSPIPAPMPARTALGCP